jgi:hypothetical protein
MYLFFYFLFQRVGLQVVPYLQAHFQFYIYYFKYILTFACCYIYQTRFVREKCARDIELSDDLTMATKTGAQSWIAIALLTRPSPSADGSLTVTLRQIKGRVWFSWAVPDLDPNDIINFTHGSCIDFEDGELTGLGTKAINKLPSGAIPVGGTLSLRYHPARGTIHARVNGGAEVLCFTDLRNDLVPAVRLFCKGDSCAIVDTQNVRFRFYVWFG